MKIRYFLLMIAGLMLTGCFDSQSQQPSEEFISQALQENAPSALEVLRWKPGEEVSDQSFLKTVQWRAGKGSLKSQDLYVVELYGTLEFTMDYGEYVFTKEGEEGENAYWARRSFGKFSKGDVIQKTGTLEFRRHNDGWQVVEKEAVVIPKEIVSIRG